MYRRLLHNLEAIETACVGTPELLYFISKILLSDITLATIGISLQGDSPAIYSRFNELQMAIQLSSWQRFTSRFVKLSDNAVQNNPELTCEQRQDLYQRVKNNLNNHGPKGMHYFDLTPTTIALKKLVYRVVKYDGYRFAASQLERSKLKDLIGAFIAAGSGASGAVLTYRAITPAWLGYIAGGAAFVLATSLTANFNGRSLAWLFLRKPLFIAERDWFATTLVILGYLLPLLTLYTSPMSALQAYHPNRSDDQTLYNDSLTQDLIPILLIAAASVICGNLFNFITRIIEPALNFKEKNYVEETFYIHLFAKLPLLKRAVNLSEAEEIRREWVGRIKLLSSINRFEKLLEADQRKLSSAIIRPSVNKHKLYSPASYMGHATQILNTISRQQFLTRELVFEALAYQSPEGAAAKAKTIFLFTLDWTLTLFAFYALQPSLKQAQRAAMVFLETNSPAAWVPMGGMSIWINAIVYSSILYTIISQLVNLERQDFAECNRYKVLYVVARLLMFAPATLAAVPSWMTGRLNPASWLGEAGASSVTSNLILMIFVFSYSLFMFVQYMRRFTVDFNNLDQFDPDLSDEEKNTWSKNHSLIVPSVLGAMAEYYRQLSPEIVKLSCEQLQFRANEISDETKTQQSLPKAVHGTWKGRHGMFRPKRAQTPLSRRDRKPLLPEDNLHRSKSEPNFPSPPLSLTPELAAEFELENLNPAQVNEDERSESDHGEIHMLIEDDGHESDHDEDPVLGENDEFEMADHDRLIREINAGIEESLEHRIDVNPLVIEQDPVMEAVVSSESESPPDERKPFLVFGM